MKSRLRVELDKRLNYMDWHGESKVWATIHGKQFEKHSIRNRSFIIALAILMVLSISALAAYMLHYSPRQNASIQARTALNVKYGMTEDIISLFDETITVNETSWEVEYELPVYGDKAGVYHVVGMHGKVEATWSYDGEQFDPNGDLSSAVWGVPQLERMRLLYKTRSEAIAHWDMLSGYSTLSIEQKAAIDAPLLDLPYSVDFINILPGSEDIQPDMAEILAKNEILRRFNLDANALEGYVCDISFMLAYGERQYRLVFRANGIPQYSVRLLSPDGQIVDCSQFEFQGKESTAEDERELEDRMLSIEDRATYHEHMRQNGGDAQQWNSVLPESDDISESEATDIAQAALLERFGVTEEKLSVMEKEIYCHIDYELLDSPTRVWYIRYVDNMDDYQVTLRAEDGTIEYISNQGGVLGVG